MLLGRETSIVQREAIEVLFYIPLFLFPLFLLMGAVPGIAQKAQQQKSKRKQRWLTSASSPIWAKA